MEKAGVKLMVGFNRRFDPSFKRIRELVASGEIGEPHILRITSRDPAPPPLAYVKVSGGIFLDMTIHDFDMARYLVGEIDEVYALGNVLIGNRDNNAGGDRNNRRREHCLYCRAFGKGRKKVRAPDTRVTIAVSVQSSRN